MAARRPKQWGTEFESAVVAAARERGLDAARHPEGGSLDHGDLWIRADRLGESPSAIHIDVECKATQTGTPHAWLALQVAKARPTAIPVVAWRRMALTGNATTRRTNLGELAILRLSDLLDLLEVVDR